MEKLPDISLGHDYFGFDTQRVKAKANEITPN